MYGRGWGKRGIKDDATNKIPSALILVSWYYSLVKGIGAPWRKADSRTGTGNKKTSLEHLLAPESKEELKKQKQKPTLLGVC